MKHRTHTSADLTDVTATASPKRVSGKKAKKLTRAEKKAARNAVLPLHKRPILCPPDRAGRSLGFRLAGYICRALVIWAASAGLMIFISAAMAYAVPSSTILGGALLTVALTSLLMYGGVGRIIGVAGTAGTVICLFASSPRLISDLYHGILALYNGALERLYQVGYLTYVQYRVTIPSETPTEALLSTGVCLLTTLIALTFTLCLVRRVHIIPPAIISTTFLAVILTFNIYSNRVESNLGIALVIVSFAAIMILAAYDRLYCGTDNRHFNRHFDTELKLFEDSDRPSLPEAYLREQELRAAKKSKKKKQKPVTVEDELRDYFGDVHSKATAPREKPSSADKKKQRAERKAMLRQVRLAKNYDRTVEQSRAAMGGFASATALAVCLVVIALPALLVRDNFSTIDAIDEKMAFARNYVTAVLRGDDERLDELEYEADGDNFKPHSTELEQLAFDGTQLFYLESRYNTNLYLRGWIGTDYADGGWQAVDDETLEAYRARFELSDSPGEEMRYNFYHYMKPSLVDDPDYNGDNLLIKYKANRDYGFVNLLVSLRRVNNPSSLCYFPSFFDSGKGIFDYATVTESELTYVNYFDGIYTGRKFKGNDAAHATVTYATVMTQDNWAEHQAKLQAAYNLQKEALLAMTGYSVDEKGHVNSYLTLMTEEQANGYTLFVYTYKRGGEELIWRFYHETLDIRQDGNTWLIYTDDGTLILEMDNRHVVGVDLDMAYASMESGYDLLSAYKDHMTDAEREALLSAITNDRLYSDFVYATYTQKSDDPYYAELAEAIVAGAHREEYVDMPVEIPDDPETEENESGIYTDSVLTNVPVDVSLAALRNATASEVYVQRDLLVRNVIDYIITEMGCQYTITPDLTAVDASLDGVQNFLRNTKEGYCVQFASAAALILRELDIPVRYVEGYVAGELKRAANSSGSHFVYTGYVHDYEAHAWIEVFFDGIGWVQYETTPQYYTGMYGSKGTGSTLPDTPVIPPLNDDPSAETEPLPEPETQGEAAETAPTVGGDEDGDSGEIMRGGLIGLAVLAVLGVLSALIYSAVSRARDAEDQRQSTVSQVLDDGFGTRVNEQDRREMALSLSDAVTNLLRLYDLAPRPGEFRDDYADRLTADLSVEPSDPAKRDGAGYDESTVPLPDLHRVLDAMAAEEFGHGMSVADMKQLALLYLYLRRDLKRRLPFSVRLHLRYIKRMI